MNPKFCGTTTKFCFLKLSLWDETKNVTKNKSQFFQNKTKISSLKIIIQDKTKNVFKNKS